MNRRAFLAALPAASLAPIVSRQILSVAHVATVADLGRALEDNAISEIHLSAGVYNFEMKPTTIGALKRIKGSGATITKANLMFLQQNPFGVPVGDGARGINISGNSSISFESCFIAYGTDNTKALRDAIDGAHKISVKSGA